MTSRLGAVPNGLCVCGHTYSKHGTWNNHFGTWVDLRCHDKTNGKCQCRKFERVKELEQ